MTLNSEIYVQGPVDPMEVFTFCQGLIEHPDVPVQEWSDEPANEWNRDAAEWVENPNVRRLANRIGQGLCAILWTKYRADGTPFPVESEDDEEGTYYEPAHYMHVSFDTGYGYSNPEKGWGCGDLHAYLIGTLGKFLDDKGVPWSWRNEFTGELWGGDDRYEKLSDLGQSGAKALTWLTGTVIPAITQGL